MGKDRIGTYGPGRQIEKGRELVTLGAGEGNLLRTCRHAISPEIALLQKAYSKGGTRTQPKRH